MHRFAKITAAALLTAACAAPALAAPETYAVDSTHSFPSFAYSHFGLSQQISKFDKTTGTVTLDKEAKTGAVDVTIDMTSVYSDDEKLTQHLSSPDFFDVAKFPTATFARLEIGIDRWSELDDRSARLVELTRPRDLDAELGPEPVD